jgi:hypothetical protein
MARKNRGKGIAQKLADALTGSAEPEIKQNLETAATSVVEEAVAKLEETEGTETPGPRDEKPIEPVAPGPLTASSNDFTAMLAAISVEDATEMSAKATASVDERASFEAVKDSSNTKIQATLKKVRAGLTNLDAARVLIASNVDPNIFNREVHTGSRYNVYALGKLVDAMNAIGTDGKKVTNAINLACMRSLFQFRANGAQFTGEMAKAAASDKIRVSASISAMLVRHTVSASTAPTQASSTMQALETLGIVKRSGNTRNPNFDLIDSPITARLEQALAA